MLEKNEDAKLDWLVCVCVCVCKAACGSKENHRKKRIECKEMHWPKLTANQCQPASQPSQLALASQANGEEFFWSQHVPSIRESQRVQSRPASQVALRPALGYRPHRFVCCSYAWYIYPLCSHCYPKRGPREQQQQKINNKSMCRATNHFLFLPSTSE